MTITPLHPEPGASIYYSPEPDALHPCVGWYFQTERGYIRGPFDTDNAALQAAAKEIEL